MPPPKPLVFCKWLRRKCRKCGRRFLKKRDRLIHDCPDCGENRECGRPAVRGYSACQEHGGPNPYRGRYGRYQDLAKFPIVKLADRYRRMQEDARVLSNRASLEIIRSRIQQLAERIDLEDAPDRLQKIGDYWAEYMEAKLAGKGADVVMLEKKISREMDKAREDYMIWAQMFEALDLDSKLVEREIKVVKEIRAFLTAEDAYDLVAKLLAVVTDVVDDPKKLRVIQYKFTKAIGERNDPTPIDVDAEDVEDTE